MKYVDTQTVVFFENIQPSFFAALAHQLALAHFMVM